MCYVLCLASRLKKVDARNAQASYQAHSTLVCRLPKKLHIGFLQAFYSKPTENREVLGLLGMVFDLESQPTGLFFESET